jgi:hypothetical protein
VISQVHAPPVAAGDKVLFGLGEFLAAFPDFTVTDYYALRWNGGEGRGLLTVPMALTRS